MEGVSRKPPLRSFSHTPIAASLAGWRVHWTPFLSLLTRQLLGTGLRFELVLIVFALTGAFELWLLFSHDPHRQFEPVVRALHRELPWFHAEATTWLLPARVAELRRALELRSIPLHVIDGASIRSATELVDELQRRFGPRRWPSEPVARSVAILNKLGARTERGVAVLWLHAEAFARGDVEGHARFATMWAATVASAAPHVLMFLVKPEPAPGTEVAPVQPVSVPGAWWRRNPGELTT